MPEPSNLELTWVEREPPLAPCAVAAWGETSHALAQRLLQRDDAQLARLSAVAGDSLLVVVAEGTELPWIDGVRYLGRDPDAPALYTPTTLRPSAPAPLVERALSREKGIAAPFAVLPERSLVVPLSGARALSRAPLAEWLAREGGRG